MPPKEDPSSDAHATADVGKEETPSRGDHEKRKRDPAKDGKVVVEEAPAKKLKSEEEDAPANTLQSDEKEEEEEGEAEKKKKKKKGALPEYACQFFSGTADKRIAYLSNFAVLPTPLRYDGHAFRTVEHAFHYAKWKCSDRPELAAELAVGGTLGKAAPLRAKKRGGRKGMSEKGAVLDVARWDVERVAVQHALLRARCAVDAAFVRTVKEVRAAGKRFFHFERGGARSYWGGSFRAPERTQWVGANKLGRMLDDLADELARGNDE